MSNIAFKKIIQVKCTKYWLDELVFARENRRKTNETHPNEVLLDKFLMKENERCVVQPSPLDYISIVVELTNYDSVIAFVLGITGNINTIHDQNFYCLKYYIPNNESETYDTLIITFLMPSLTNAENDKIKTSKRVTFGWSEKPTREHRNLERIPCNENGVFYPRQKYIHYA